MNAILTTITMFVTLMEVIVAIKLGDLMEIGLEMVVVLTFTTLKCAIMTKGIVVTTQELLMGYVMTQTITEFAIMMEETAALELRILIAALCVTALMSLM